ncbi:MerR family transcriptional regulator [Paracoccus tegillarcae]|uniref:MerR family transcriptional regulator n=1 Tax=Paracoccus tegillarcae TaxID=1529068 RepID=A0A2K9EN56_9RHOB|nr:helix-turn-helix domain-containing protein [Paracoccus tegillarcae]AUH33075.1 MerR family transcriptional regulator [Paracoccus tegillarcae]
MLSIGKLSKATDVKVPTIRYYEQIGMLPQADRTAGNQRAYSQATVERLTFIRHARDLGFSLQSIRDLLELSDKPDQSCAEVDRIAAQQLAEVSRRIMRLTALKDELDRMLHHCACGTIAECRVIEVLGNHDLCEGRHEGDL